MTNKNRLSTPRPNEYLRRERLLRGWTQADVAGYIGTDGYTVNRWERGRARPGPHFRQLLCALFDKSALELGLVPALQDHPVSIAHTENLPASYWYVPRLRNPLFTGHENLLESLHTYLCVEQVMAPRSCALYGLGGIGKTQLAVEYAYRYASAYHAIFWIDAESPERLLASFLAIADYLQLPEYGELDRYRTMTAVHHWLSNHQNWLLIWDNLEEFHPFQYFLTQVRQGTHLITTRKSILRTLASPQALPQMTPEEGCLFLLRRAGAISLSETKEQISQSPIYAAAGELVTILGGLPLALDQAGAYIEETGCGIADYLSRYQQQRAKLLNRRGASSADHPLSVMATLRLSIRRVARDYPLAIHLLYVCAWLDAEAIPEELFRADPSSPTCGNDRLTLDPYQFDQTIAVLRNFSLVQRHPGTRTLSLHRLVQVVLQEEMSEDERTQWQQHAIKLLDMLFPEVIYDVWRKCDRLLPHILTCYAALSDQAYNYDLAHLLQRAADYLRERAQHEQAESLYQQALQILKQEEESEQILAANILRGLALIYYTQGQWEQARPLAEQALNIHERVLGPDHVQVTRSSNNLAIILSQLKEYRQAEQLHKQALDRLVRTLGPAHVRVAYPLNNLAELSYMQGNLEQAEALFQRALHIWKEAWGSDHPQTAHPLNGLANIYKDQGKYEQARMLYQRALHLREQGFGPEAPDLVYPLDGLADLACMQGDYKEAKALYQRSLHIRERHLGQDHAETAEILARLRQLHEKKA